MLTSRELVDLIKREKARLICNVDKLGASSERRTFKVTNYGQSFKLRKCISISDAKHLEDRIKSVSSLGVTPEFLGRYREWICFRYLSLPEARRSESNRFWFRLGFNIALLESIESRRIDTSFAQEYDSISIEKFEGLLTKALRRFYSGNYLSKKELQIALGQIKDFFQNKIQGCYGYLDLLPGNVLKDKDKVLLADEEGISRTIAGLSLIRPLDIWRGQTPEKGIEVNSERYFFKGYMAAGGDLSFFKSNRNKLGIIYYTLKSYDSLLHTGKTHRSMRRLKYFLSK